MDPLSITASIIAVLQLSSSITSYISDLKHVSRDQKKLALEASSIYGLLIDFRSRVEDVHSTAEPWFNHIKTLGQPQGVLEQLKTKLESLADQLVPSRRSEKLKQILTYSWTKAETTDIMNEIERLKTIISLALTEDHFHLSQAIHRDISGLNEGVERLLRVHDDEASARIISWLRLPDVSSNYHAALKQRQAGTGSWLISSENFFDWRQQPGTIIWLHGIAGCGKTILSATALETVYDRHNGEENTLIGYFYFDSNDRSKQSPQICLRSLAYQLSLQSIEGLALLKQLYTSCDSGYREPHDDEIADVLHRIIGTSRACYIILDALDESSCYGEILRIIQDLNARHIRTLRILITSRHEKEFIDALSPIVNYDVDIQNFNVDKDIRSYIRARLLNDPKLRKWRPDEKHHIETSLMSKAGGMFRWVYCQLDSIQQCIKPSALRRVLSCMPESLHQTYDQILSNLDKEQLKDAVTVLQCVCFSKRQLTLAEIREILAIDYDHPGKFCSEDRLPDPADLIKICSSLIRIQLPRREYSEMSVERREYEEHLTFSGLLSKTVELAHHSVREYLLSENSRFASYFNAAAAEIKLSKTCLIYLVEISHNSSLTYDKLQAEHPFWDYAVRHWYLHVESCQLEIDLSLRSLVEKVFLEDLYFSVWRHLHAPDGSEGTSSLENSLYSASPLYFASFLGLNWMVELLIDSGHDVNSKGGIHGFPICAAAMKADNTSIIQRLLRAGAGVDSQIPLRYTAIHLAVLQTHNNNVKTLIEAGADVNSQEYYDFNTVLDSATSTAGNAAGVKLLLDAGADVNFPHGEGGDTLHRALEYGTDAETVQLLLKAGAKVNNHSGRFSSALQAAAYGSSDKLVIKMLIDAGEDINHIGGRFGSALQAAAFFPDRLSVAHELIDSRADVNAQGGQYGNPLQAASYRSDNLALVQTLLMAGADVKAVGGKYKSALLAAAVAMATDQDRDERIVWELINAGADVNVYSEEYGTALEQLSFAGAQESVRLLCDAGADLNAPGSKGRTALLAALGKGQERIAHMLLDRGADINQQCKEYGSPLRTAINEPCKEVAIRLIGAGACIDGPNGIDDNLLERVKSYDDQEFTDKLWRHVLNPPNLVIRT